MRGRIEKILERRTGEGIAVWVSRIAELGEIDEVRLRAWLTQQGVTGYPQMVLVMDYRVDVGLRLPGVDPRGPLLAAPGLGNDYVNVRIALRSPDDIDDTVVEWLRRAHQANV
jgi:hypothetical protein